jgi:hypothetical protein
VCPLPRAKHYHDQDKEIAAFLDIKADLLLNTFQSGLLLEDVILKLKGIPPIHHF